MSRFNLRRQRIVNWKKLWWTLAAIAALLLSAGLLCSIGCQTPGGNQAPVQQRDVLGDALTTIEQQTGISPATAGMCGLILLAGIALIWIATAAFWPRPRTLKGMGVALGLIGLLAALIVYLVQTLRTMM